MSPGLKRLLFNWLPLIAYCLMIYIQSDLPSPEGLPSFTFSDKLLHFAAYGLLGILFYRAYQTLRLRNNRQLLFFLSVASAVLYGISDEIHQYFVPFRDADALDAIANSLGAACGVYIYQRRAAARENGGQKTERLGYNRKAVTRDK